MSGGPKVAILGAGSIGCFIGGAWQSAGLPVTYVGRAKLAKDIGKHGLTLTDYSGWQVRLEPGNVDFRCRPEALEEADVICVAVKSADTAEAAAEIAKHAHEGATVVSFQNGISNLDVLAKALRGRFEIARGSVGFNVAYLGNGRFHKGVAGHLWSERQNATQAISERAGAGPGALKLSDDMLGLAWGKLLINMNNAVNALSGRTLREELRKRDYRRVFAASVREGLGLLRRAGIEPGSLSPLPIRLLPAILETPDWLFNNLFFRMWKIDPKARSSMSDDLALGRKTEVDYLNGEIIRLAEQLSMDAPVNRAIAALVHEAEDGAAPLAPAALRRAALRR
jgi:2-dehydropantoate 2-reductase